jgi:hypothetical protein
MCLRHALLLPHRLVLVRLPGRHSSEWHHTTKA